MGRNERQAYLKAILRLNRATTMTMNSTEIPPYRSVAKCQYIDPAHKIYLSEYKQVIVILWYNSAWKSAQ